MTDSLAYIRARAVNALDMLRRGEWKLIFASLGMELNLRRHNIADRLRGQRGSGSHGTGGSHFVNLRRVIPASKQPQEPCCADPAWPSELPNKAVLQDTRIANTIEGILSSIDIDAEYRSPGQSGQAPGSSLNCDNAHSDLLAIAATRPLDLAAAADQSPFYRSGQYDNLYRSVLCATRKVCLEQSTECTEQVLRALQATLVDILGGIATHNFFSHLQLLLGLRRLRMGIYDYAGHFAGGGQRYVAEMAALAQDRYDVTYLFNQPVELARYRDWYDLDLSRCSTRIIPIPFFDQRGITTPNESMVLGLRNNVFDIVARETLHFDIFINANMLCKVNPLSLQSAFICHFPDKDKDRFFQVDKYDHLVANGDYTSFWLRERWQMAPTQKLYPPVSMDNEDSSPEGKEQMVLSVARFDTTGSKKQLELVQAFCKLRDEHPEASKGWKLVLAGGSADDNHYLSRVRAEASASGCDIEFVVNANVESIRTLYRQASLFWHACGLDESRPERVEHFGMTTVEAMQNHCIPVVIDGGGQREIVNHGRDGYRFKTIDELAELSAGVMADTALREQLALQAYERSRRFSGEVFEEGVNNLYAAMERDLLNIDWPRNRPAGSSSRQ